MTATTVTHHNAKLHRQSSDGTGTIVLANGSRLEVRAKNRTIEKALWEQNGRTATVTVRPFKNGRVDAEVVKLELSLVFA